MSGSTYIACHFKVKQLQPAVEILIAELAEVGFESFVETDDGVIAYVQEKEWFEAILTNIQILKSGEFEISYTTEKITPVNWNAEWEKNFSPIVVDHKCTVRAPFHEAPETEYDIIIEPKMSFGTGHHETTHMMIQHMLQENFQNKTVLDMGCGTGILAIFSEMKGAKQIDAIDINNWCYQNSLENATRNKCKNIRVYKGDASLLSGRTYDIILANINRNILLADIRIYSKCLNKNGMLLVSGFYAKDIIAIENECSLNMLKLVKKRERDNWVSLKFLN